MAKPIATPACGIKAKPRYVRTFLSHFVIVVEEKAPSHFPITLKIRYTRAIAIIITAFFEANILKSNDAPLMTKNSINIGGVIKSILSKVMSLCLPKLIKVAPQIIVDKSPEVEKLTPSGKNVDQGRVLTPTHIKIAIIHIIILFALEAKKRKQKEMIRPHINPSTIEANIESKGQTARDKKLGVVPLAIALAMENNTSKTINATASSNATTGKRVLTTGPLALYCLMTIRVAAGAVAQLIAPKVNMISTGISEINIFVKNSPNITKIDAPRASKTVIKTILLPTAFNDENLNEAPIEKAIKPRATLLI